MQAPTIPVIFFRSLPEHPKCSTRNMMSLLDQFFVYHPEPWQDRNWARLSGWPFEDVWFQAVDGARLFGWYAEAQADRPVILWCHDNAGGISFNRRTWASSIGLDCPTSSSTIAAIGGVRGGHQRKALNEGAFNSTLQLIFLEAIRQLELRCRRL
jgi:hypothetical protein